MKQVYVNEKRWIAGTLSKQDSVMHMDQNKCVGIYTPFTRENAPLGTFDLKMLKKLLFLRLFFKNP